MKKLTILLTSLGVKDDPQVIKGLSKEAKYLGVILDFKLNWYPSNITEGFCTRRDPCLGLDLATVFDSIAHTTERH